MNYSTCSYYKAISPFSLVDGVMSPWLRQDYGTSDIFNVEGAAVRVNVKVPTLFYDAATVPTLSC
jgi:hypothetical protein